MALARTVVEVAARLRVLSLLKNNSFICPYQRFEEKTERRCFMTPMNLTENWKL
jgi:hypothetical protein